MFGKYHGLFFSIMICMVLSACGNAAAHNQPTLAITSTLPELIEMPYSENRQFTLESPEVVDEGPLPAEYTCDGASATLPLAWSSAPAGTVSFALVMHHTASPQDVHWYWIVYDIPAGVSSLEKNSSGIGSLGTNSVNGKCAYSPPCSKGSGEKEYVFTVYALSGRPAFSVPADQVNREALLKSIQSITLASAELHVIYVRK